MKPQTERIKKENLPKRDNETKELNECLCAIAAERYQMSFNRDQLTSAIELHKEAKRLLGIETGYA